MDPYASPQAYRDSAVLTASPEQLVVMLYDGARALPAPGRGRTCARAPGCPLASGCSRAEAILDELLATLNMDTGEIAERLQAIYVFCKRCLIEARIQRNPTKVTHVIRLLADLREAWATVAGGRARLPSRHERHGAFRRTDAEAPLDRTAVGRSRHEPGARAGAARAEELAMALDERFGELEGIQARRAEAMRALAAATTLTDDDRAASSAAAESQALVTCALTAAHGRGAGGPAARLGGADGHPRIRIVQWRSSPQPDLPTTLLDLPRRRVTRGHGWPPDLTPIRHGTLRHHPIALQAALHGHRAAPAGDRPEHRQRQHARLPPRRRRLQRLARRPRSTAATHGAGRRCRPSGPTRRPPSSRTATASTWTSRPPARRPTA